VFTIANWKYKHGLSNRLNNGGMVQGLGFGTVIFTHRFDQSDRGCARTITNNTGFSTLRNTRGILVTEVGLVVPFSAAYTLR
jgi:hypothetical protein